MMYQLVEYVFSKPHIKGLTDCKNSAVNWLSLKESENADAFIVKFWTEGCVKRLAILDSTTRCKNRLKGN